MAGTTAKLALPYPTGTDRVADGDNAMQALAERIEARMPWGSLGTARCLATVGPAGAFTITGMNLSPVGLPAGRALRVVAVVELQMAGGGISAEVRLKFNGTIVQTGKGGSNAGLPTTVSLETIVTSVAGANAFTVDIAAATGTVQVNGSATSTVLIVQDLGVSP